MATTTVKAPTLLIAITAFTVFRLRSALRLIRNNSTVRGGGIFLFGGIAVHVLYYLYRIAMGRILSPADFGEIAVFLSAMLIFTVPALPLQTIAAKVSAEYAAEKNFGALRQFGIRITLIVAGAVGVFFGGIVLFAQKMTDFFQLSSAASIYMLFGVVLIILLFAILRGVLQGLERFVELSSVTFIEGIARLGLGILFVLMGFAVAGAIVGILASVVVAYGLGFWFMRDVLRTKNTERFVYNGGFFTHALYMILAFLALNIFLNVDILLVKHYFTPEATGVFSAFATLGRGTALFGMLFAAVLFPIIVRRKKQQESIWQPFLLGLGATAALSLSAVLVLFIFGRFLLLFLLGEQYIYGAPYVGPYALTMAGVGLVFYISHYFMALGHFRFVWVILAGSVLHIILLVLWHNTFGEVLLAMGVSLFFLLAAFTFLVWNSFVGKKLSTV